MNLIRSLAGDVSGLGFDLGVRRVEDFTERAEKPPCRVGGFGDIIALGIQGHVIDEEGKDQSAPCGCLHVPCKGLARQDRLAVQGITHPVGPGLGPDVPAPGLSGGTALANVPSRPRTGSAVS